MSEWDKLWESDEMRYLLLTSKIKALSQVKAVGDGLQQENKKINTLLEVVTKEANESLTKLEAIRKIVDPVKSSAYAQLILGVLDGE